MIEGRIRDFAADKVVYDLALQGSEPTAAKRAQAVFRRDFTAPLLASEQVDAAVLAQLAWGTRVELAAVIAATPLTAVTVNGVQGFVATHHLVEIAYVGRGTSVDPKKLTATLDCGKKGKRDLIWGDMVQVLARDGALASVRARGQRGTIAADRLEHIPLLECYFVDVGQGDGVLVRFPDGQHMVIDGGLPRSRQQTGKNGADFVDWKFFSDYGDWAIDLDWMIASHSDLDHYGGLADLVDQDRAAREQLDTIAVRVARFGHPGLARFPETVDEEGLGPRGPVGGRDCFTRLLGDRADAELLTSTAGDSGLKMSGPWASFIKGVLRNDAETRFERLAITQSEAETGALPLLGTLGGCSVRVLAPVTVANAGSAALPDLTPTANRMSINTNGHSVCLRLDFLRARILLTGDLNTASMKWLQQAFTDGHMGEWRCDVAKGCHHGSSDVSFGFLKAVQAAATVISSGDNEGHGHPSPEIVAASALSGRVELSADGDRVITPLIYMTEIERSVQLSEINRIEIANLGQAGRNFTLLGKPVDEFGGREFMTKDELTQFDDIGLGALTDDQKKAAKKALIDSVSNRERPRLEALQVAEQGAATGATMCGRRPVGVIGDAHMRDEFYRMRAMEKNVYGLVNVRTDGALVMCASMRDDGEHWTVHAFAPGF